MRKHFVQRRFFKALVVQDVEPLNESVFKSSKVIVTVSDRNFEKIISP